MYLYLLWAYHYLGTGRFNERDFRREWDGEREREKKSVLLGCPGTNEIANWL